VRTTVSGTTVRDVVTARACSTLLQNHLPTFSADVTLVEQSNREKVFEDPQLLSLALTWCLAFKVKSFEFLRMSTRKIYGFPRS
jgi:hypothetical protein